MVFQKEVKKIEEKQKLFILKVSDYYKGYWITKYKYSHDLQKLVLNSFASLLKDRASIGYRLNYFDHFVRIAIQRNPIPTAQVLYSVEDDVIEFRYRIFNKIYTIHFSKSEIYKDFWGCVGRLESSFIGWSR